MAVLDVAPCGGFVGKNLGRRFEPGADAGGFAAFMHPVINFNLMRFIAATSVLVSHGFALATGDAANEPFRSLLGLSLGDIAVGVFFVFFSFRSMLAATD